MSKVMSNRDLVILDANYKKLYRELVSYEVEQFRKAFAVGTNEAWARYRRAVKKAAKAFEHDTGDRIDLDVLMSGEGSVGFCDD